MPKTKELLALQWRMMLSEYVTAIAWSPSGATLAVSSAAGEVVLYQVGDGQMTLLQSSTGQSIDCLAFSADGQYLATGGQDGSVRVWQVGSAAPQLLKELTHSRVWIDRLGWHPQVPELAFSLGRTVQVWNAQTQARVTTLDFATSSVLDLAWHPQGTSLSVSGHQAIKTWQYQAWEEEPQIWETSAASRAIAWSPSGEYWAAGNSDRTLLVWQWQHPFPWQMQGFPGKVRQVAWSAPLTKNTPLTKNSVPLLAASSASSIVVWAKRPEPADDWQPTILDRHEGIVTAIAFQPRSLLLASAAEDGWVCLWDQAKQVAQILEGAPNGFSCLAWQPQGDFLAAGGQEGELLVWSRSSRGRGFG